MRERDRPLWENRTSAMDPMGEPHHMRENWTAASTVGMSGKKKRPEMNPGPRDWWRMVNRMLTGFPS